MQSFSVGNVITTLSKERLQKYLRITQENEEDALNLYLDSIKLCQKALFPLHILEVLLRNSIHNKLKQSYSDCWYLDESLLFNTEIRKVQDVHARLERQHKKVTGEQVITELSFGFWVNLFNARYEEKLWRKYLYEVFPYAPKKYSRKLLRHNLTPIYKLRNRIAHHENVINWPVEEIIKQMIEVISWISRDTSEWVIHNSKE